jgi:transposase
LSILTRQERERLVLDLYYNQGKTIREISKEARMSFRDIGVILNKAVEEKTEELKEDNNGADKNQEQEEQQLSLSTQAYKLFCKGKTLLEVSIALNLRESEATLFYREYWKLNQLHNLNMVYEEIKDDIEPFLKLYKLAKRKGLGVQQVVDILAIANNDLPAIEERFKRLGNDMSMLQAQKHTCKGNLY